MTYYRILQYLKANGLDDGKAHYVRNMIRELVNESIQHTTSSLHQTRVVGHHRVSHDGPCPNGCYYETVNP